MDVLPIEEAPMPADVSDLKDVFDAINKLCETMRTSNYDEETFEDCPASEVEDAYVECSSEIVSVEEVVVEAVDCRADELVSPEDVVVRTVDSYRAERWGGELMSPPQDDVETIPSDTEPALAAVSDMYYTASSEVSLLSDMEPPDRQYDEESKEIGDKKECVISGHVAAMRERFESMTRTNTPCPDLMRSSSPSLEVYRNITPSPDLLR